MVKLFIGTICRDHGIPGTGTIPAIAVATEAWLVTGNNIEIRKPSYSDPEDIVLLQHQITVEKEIPPFIFIDGWTENEPHPVNEAAQGYQVYKII